MPVGHIYTTMNSSSANDSPISMLSREESIVLNSADKKESSVSSSSLLPASPPAAHAPTEGSAASKPIPDKPKKKHSFGCCEAICCLGTSCLLAEICFPEKSPFCKTLCYPLCCCFLPFYLFPESPVKK